MSIKQRQLLGLTIFILALLLLAGVVYYLFFYNFEDEPVEQPESADQGQVLPNTGDLSNNIPDDTADEIEPSTVRPTPPEYQTPSDMRQVASIFTERYGTYSNQSGENYSDLKFFTTSQLQQWLSDQLETPDDYENYQGITTRAISVKVLEQNKAAATATVMVSTRRTKSTLSQTESFDQDLKLEMRQIGGKWRVHGAYWQ